MLKSSAGSGTTLQIEIMLGDRLYLRLTVNSASEELFYFDKIKDFTITYRLVYAFNGSFRIFFMYCPYKELFTFFNYTEASSIK